MGVRLDAASNDPSDSADYCYAGAEAMGVAVEKEDTETGGRNAAAAAASKVLEERVANAAAAASPSHRSGSCAWERTGNRCPARTNLAHRAEASAQRIGVARCARPKAVAIR